jgi:hypothetical protein
MIVYGRTRLPTAVGLGARAVRSGRSDDRVVQNFDFTSDPAVAFDQNGTGWYSFLVVTNDESQSRVVVNRLPAGATSVNQFQANNTGLPLRGTDDTADKEMIAIDRFPASPHRGRIYVVWNENKPNGAQHVVMSFCDTIPAGSPACSDPDSWSAPVQISDDSFGSTINADVAPAPNGDVYVVWWNFADNEIDGDVCRHTSNCGSSSGWGTDVTVHLLNNDNVNGLPGGDPIPFFCPILAAPAGRTSPVPSIDVSGNAANTGRVFVALGDIRSAPGATRCHETFGDNGANYMPLLTDRRWDAFVGVADNALPTTVTTSATGNAPTDNFLPWLAVDQSTGKAETGFYTTVGNPDLTRDKARYSRAPISTGGTPGATSTLSNADSDYSGANSTRNDYGDYEQVASAGSQSYPVWTDGSNLGKRGEVFFRKVTLPSTLGTEMDLTTGSTQGGETAVDTSGSGGSTHVLAGANNMIDPPMWAWLSTDNGAIFTGPKSLPVNAELQTLRVSNAPVVEGNSGSRSATFTVSLSGPARGPVTVRAFTGGGTATAGSDYTPVSTTLSFSTGQSSKTVSVPVLGDGAHEANETFFLGLANAKGGLISRGIGVGTILDDDPAPDTTKPRIRLTIGGQRVVRRKAIIVKFRSNERVRATFSTRISVPGASRSFRIRRVRRTVGPNRTTKIKIKVPRKVRRAIRQALRQHRRVRAKVSVTAADGAGNKSKKSKKFRIRR